MTISLSKLYPTMVLVDEPTYSDAILIARRTIDSVDAILSEALHMGMPLYLDKWEAIFAREPGIYPLVDEGVPDVERYLFTTRLTGQAEHRRKLQEYMRRQLMSRQGAA